MLPVNEVSYFQDYIARGHNLNLYVGWAKSFSCPPTSLKKVKFVTAKSIIEKWWVAVKLLPTNAG